MTADLFNVGTRVWQDDWMLFNVGTRVRQDDWMLPRARYGVVVRLGEKAQGTPHRWLYVEFPGHLTGRPVVVRCSSAQLKPLDLDPRTPGRRTDGRGDGR